MGKANKREFWPQIQLPIYEDFKSSIFDMTMNEKEGDWCHCDEFAKKGVCVHAPDERKGCCLACDGASNPMLRPNPRTCINPTCPFCHSPSVTEKGKIHARDCSSRTGWPCNCYLSIAPTTPPERKGWSEKFDEEFDEEYNGIGHKYFTVLVKDIKSFIQNEIEVARDERLEDVAKDAKAVGWQEGREYGYAEGKSLCLKSVREMIQATKSPGESEGYDEVYDQALNDVLDKLDSLAAPSE